ncbi:MAG: ABC transporter permease [Salinivirgaceae bacterium]|jgi:putative ABC transport system permease protein|nr:ABC transporter permease [Salinivirgaceae bacterium]
MYNGIKYALRNIRRNKLNAFITIVSLSIAFASVLIIYLYVTQEQSYNSFHAKADNTYRLNYRIIIKDGTTGANHLVNPDLAEYLKDKVPQIENCTPFRIGSMAQLALDDQNLKVKLGIAEQEFFNMFSFELLYGNKDDLLVKPTNIVLTQSLAKKLLGKNAVNTEELIGQPLTFTFLKNTVFTIVGVLKDTPKNSTIDFEALIPYEHEQVFWQSNNSFGNSSLFIELKNNTDKEQAKTQVCENVKLFYKKDIERAQKNNFLQASEKCFEPYCMPIKEGYLDTAVQASYERVGNKTQLSILSIVAILILLIAFSNFVILTLGQSFKKAGEVSIRKSVGGKQIDILKMFLNENSIIILASFIIGVFLSHLFIPVFNQISQGEIYFGLVNMPALITFAFITICLLIFMTSLIPVLIFRKVKPTLNSAKKLLGRKNSGSSQVFVGLQYTLTTILIIATIAISKQTSYLKNKSLGFSDDNIISIDVPYLSESTAVVLRDILKKQPDVINAALTNRNYFDGYSTHSFEVSDYEVINAYTFKADQYFIPTLGISLIEGRNLSEENMNKNDHSIIVNETFVSKMNFDGSPVGQIVDTGSDKFKIIGVVKDYQFLTSREKIEPMILHARNNMDNDYSAVLLKFNPQNIKSVIAAIELGWKEIETKEELKYIFWDKELENRYQSEDRLSKIISYASIIAIIILTMGLFGLTILISAQRINEIGIRKVNGAKVSEVILLLNGDYIKWVFIALIFSCPIAWYFLNQWLQGFAYKTDLSWWIFATAGSIALGIALLTVSFQSWKAATRNPVKALRYE